jgi:hypothetical protein
MADDNCCWSWDALSAEAMEANPFTQAFEDQMSGNEKTEDIRYYCKITLDRFDKAVVEKKFNPFVRKPVIIDFAIDTFTDKEAKKRTFFRLKSLRKKQSAAC